MEFAIKRVANPPLSFFYLFSFACFVKPDETKKWNFHRLPEKQVQSPQPALGRVGAAGYAPVRMLAGLLCSVGAEGQQSGWDFSS